MLDTPDEKIAVTGQVLMLIHDSSRLYEENAKLRELVRDMFRDFANCDYELKRHGRTFMAVTRYFDRVRELGIEVD